jgi:hypothetical protein
VGNVQARFLKKPQQRHVVYHAGAHFQRNDDARLLQVRDQPREPPGDGSNRLGAEGLKRLLAERGVMPTDYDDWRKIEEAEIGNARPGSPREKFVRVADWLSALGR